MVVCYGVMLWWYVVVFCCGGMLWCCVVVVCCGVMLCKTFSVFIDQHVNGTIIQVALTGALNIPSIFKQCFNPPRH